MARLCRFRGLVSSLLRYVELVPTWQNTEPETIDLRGLEPRRKEVRPLIRSRWEAQTSWRDSLKPTLCLWLRNSLTSCVSNGGHEMDRKLDRRAFLKLTAAMTTSLFAGSVLSNCAPAPAPTPQPVVPTAAPQPTVAPLPTATPAPTKLPYAGASINFLTHPVFQPLLPSLDEYEKMTGAKIVFEGMPYPGIRDKIALELSTNSSAYDIVSMGSQWWTKSMVPGLEPISKFIASSPPEALDKVNKGMLEYNKSGGDQIGWPIRSGVFILFYRKDLYEQKKLSVPKTFEELRANAVALNSPPNTYGFYVMGTPDGFAHDDWVNTLFCFGGRILSDDGKKCLLDSPEALAATQFWSEWMEKGLVPPGTAEHNYADLITAFQQGLTAQAIAWSPYAISVNDPKTSKFSGKIGFAVVPVWEKSNAKHSITFSTGWNAYIPKASKNKEAAWNWLKWMTNTQNDLAMALKGNGPVRDTTYDSTAYNEQNPAAAVTKEGLAYGIMATPPVEPRAQISQLIAVELSGVAAGKKKPADALKSMMDQIKPLL